MPKINLLEKVENFIRTVDKHYPVELAYLFGSFANNTANIESDIDLAFLFTENYDDKDEILVKGTIIDMGEKFFRRKLDVVSLNSATPLLRYEIIKKGISLKESKKRATFESLAIREYFDFSHYSKIYNDAMIKSIQEEM